MLVERMARAVEAPPGVLGRAEDELPLLLAPIRAAPDEKRTEEGRGEAQRYLCPKRMGNAVLRCADSVSMTAHAETSTTAIARITSTIGFVKNFQILCQ